jgi:hypothetical protein
MLNGSFIHNFLTTFMASRDASVDADTVELTSKDSDTAGE